MFDFAWSEIALIGIVALVAIGPKDLPVAIKAVAAAIKKARRMASEFQVHVDEMVREANLHEVRDSINDLRRMDIKGKILDAVDGDGTLRKTVADNPLAVPPAAPLAPLPDPVAVAAPDHAISVPDLTPGAGAAAGLGHGPASVHDLAPGPVAHPPGVTVVSPVAPAPAAPVSAGGLPPFPLPEAAPHAAPAPLPPVDAPQPPLHA